MVVFNINFKNIKTTLLNVFLYIIDVEDLSLIYQLSLILSLSLSLSSLSADIKAKCGYK